MRRSARAIAAWLLCAAFLTCAMRTFGNRQLGAFDDNIIIDTAWRMFIGQKPYIDFYLPLSPEFYLGAGWAFRLWGVNWSALVRISIVFAVFTFALQSIALSHFIPRRYAISISLACQMLAMMVTSYWWYNSNASITACLLFSVSLALVARPASKTLAIIFCITLMMLSLMKVNIAAVSILVVLMPLLTVRELRGRLIVWIPLSALIVLALLMVCHLDPVAIVKAYLKMAGTRGMPNVGNFFRGKPNEAFISLPMIGSCLAVFAVACRQVFRTPRLQRPSRSRQVLFIAASGILVGVWCMSMSVEQSLISGVPLILVSSSTLILWALKERVVEPTVPLTLTFTVLMCGCATAVGLVLYQTLPFGFLVGRFGLAMPFMAMLMVWSFLAVTSVVTFLASLFGSSWWNRISSLGSTRLIERFRPWALIAVIAVVAGASAAFYMTAQRLPTRTEHVFAPYVALLMLWSAVAVLSAAAFVAIASRASGWLRPAEKLGRWSVVLVIVMVTTAGAALFVSGMRIKVRNNGLFYSSDPAVAIGRPFFRGFSASPSLKAVTEQIETVLSEFEKQGFTRNIFFGIRLEFAYAAFGIPSPTHIPVWWDPDAAYPPGDQAQIVEGFVAHRFPLCIFYGNDPELTYLPAGIVEELNTAYRRVGYSELTVFVRNP